MTKKTSKIASKVDLESVKYERQTRGRKTDRAVVTYAKSTKTLYFNPKMVKILNIPAWDQVIIGYDRKTNIMLLRCCDSEEYGAVALTLPPVASASMKNKELYENRRKDCRLLKVSHILHHFNGGMPQVFRAEREGEIVFLESVDADLDEANG